MLSTPEFWVFIAFVLLLVSVGKRGLRFLTQTLDEHSQKVAHQLAESQRLHDEALSLLNTYKKKHQEATEQAEKIISFAENEAMEFKKLSQQEFEKFLAQKEKAVLERIVVATEETKSMLRKQVADEAIAITERLLSKEKVERKKLTKAALKEIETVDLTPQPLKNLFEADEKNN